MVTRALSSGLAVLLLGGCPQFTPVEGSAVAPLARPLVLMHRGAGANNPDFRENTIPALLFGAGRADGTEMDLQLGADGTIWLGHDNEVRDCSDPAGGATGGAVVGCFQSLHDAAIEAVAHCDTATAAPCADTSAGTCVQHYVRLEEVFQRFSSDPTLVDKFLALDVKDQLCGSTGLPEARLLADGIDRLTRAYHMEWRLFVEGDQVAFLREFRGNGTPTYLFVEGYGSIDPIIEDAVREGATGVSYKYYDAPVDPALAAGLRNLGLRTIAWPVPQPPDNLADIDAVWAMRPDVILTDNPDFLLHVLVPGPF